MSSKGYSHWPRLAGSHCFKKFCSPSVAKLYCSRKVELLSANVLGDHDFPDQESKADSIAAELLPLDVREGVVPFQVPETATALFVMFPRQ